MTIFSTRHIYNLPLVISINSSYSNLPPLTPSQVVPATPVVLIQPMTLALKPIVETGVLDPRPKLPGFHMPGEATHSYTPNKEGRERRFIT
jgi:hypothetical protein